MARRSLLSSCDVIVMIYIGYMDAAHAYAEAVRLRGGEWNCGRLPHMNGAPEVGHRSLFPPALMSSCM